MTSSAASFFERAEARGISAITAVERLLLSEYGAVFVAKGVSQPPCVVFADEPAVNEFQAGVAVSHFTLGDFAFTLQRAAADALLAAAAEARDRGKSVSPRGPDSGDRDYAGTVELWASRVEPALEHWLSERRISVETARAIRTASPFDQVPKVLELEHGGIFFAKDLSKSIIYSVAPPGASQHLSLLAFDVAEFDDPEVRTILSRYGWFQTVTSDLPHFTYLGAREEDLPELGLIRVECADRHFWVPDI